MNSVNLSGRIANDLKVQKTRDNVSILNFSMAVKRPHKKDTTDFIRVSCFRQNADYLNQYAKKGTLIGVSGIIMAEQYTDRNGANVTAVKVAAESVEILESKKESNTMDTTGFVVDEDDLPF